VLTQLQAALAAEQLPRLRRDLRTVQRDLQQLPRSAVGKSGGLWASLQRQELSLQRAIADLETRLRE
jgi:hypothetical protein